MLAVTTLLGLAAVGALATVTGATQQAAQAARAVGPAGKIKHVVVIFQENHSFDETLGAYCRAHPGRCDGYIGPVTLKNGTVVAMTQSPDVVPPVSHDVNSQIKAVNGGAMNGWASLGGCTAASRYQCLTYYTPAQIPSLTALADKYVVSDRTFSMANSPSWGGHIYPVAATLDNFTGEIPVAAPGIASGPGWGCDSKRIAQWVDPVTHQISMQPSCIPAKPGTLDPTLYPFNGAFQATKAQYVPTIFDSLDTKRLPWKLYSSTPEWGICPSFAECLYGPQHNHLVSPTSILTDAKSGTLPAYSVLLPSGPGGTGQHNDHSMLVGDNWIGKVMAALQTSPQWSSTAVFITYDDCGCFYDHVAPGVNPDGTKQGIRLPTVIVSPFAKVGATDSKPATLASMLRFTEEAFGLPALSVNDRLAYDFAGAFNFAAPGTPPRAKLRQHPVPAATLRFVATHLSADPNDPT
jgi:phospholipase C